MADLRKEIEKRRTFAIISPLSTGNDLKDHDLTELCGILGDETGACFTCNAGTDTGACACKACCQTCAQKAYCKAGVCKQKFHNNFLLFYSATL